ncbi:hypothetical protein LCM08_20815 [Salipiger pacificus]|nr:hypothetical protein [Alloyangia pacifica]
MNGSDAAGGWVCSYRRIWDHTIFENNAMRVGVWHWLLHMAVWKPEEFYAGRHRIVLERGQMCVSQRQIQDATGMGRQAVRTFLDVLEQHGAINRRQAQGLTQGRTIITICNYEKLQGESKATNPNSNHAATQKQPTKEQVTNNNPPPEGEADASEQLPISAAEVEQDVGEPSGETIEISVIASTLWATGKRYLASKGVKNGGSVIGKWLKSYDALTVLQAIDQAQRSGTGDPVPYITATLSQSPEKGLTHAQRTEQRRREDLATRELIRRVGNGDLQRGPDPSDPFARR